MKHLTELSVEDRVRNIQNWINSIGFDAWEGRGYRSRELLGGLCIEVFKPDQYAVETIRQMISVVNHNRELIVVDEIGSKANGLQSGRLLGHRLGETTCTAEAKEITEGFFDEYDVPSWDTWVDFIENDELAKSEGAYLIAWIPTDLIDVVDSAVEASFEANIFWLSQAQSGSSPGSDSGFGVQP